MKPKAGISFEAEQLVFITRLIAYGWTAFICKWRHEGFQKNTEDLLQLFKNEPSYLIWVKRSILKSLASSHTVVFEIKTVAIIEFVDKTESQKKTPPDGYTSGGVSMS